MNLLILYIFPRILRICSYINLNTIDFSFLTRNPKTFSFLFDIVLCSGFVIAMLLNTFLRLSQIYDNSRLFSSISKTAVLFYIALRSVVIRCLWNYFDKAALMRIINENVSDGCPLFSSIILIQSAFQRPHSVDCLTKCNAAVVWRYQAMSQYFKALFLQSFIHHFQ